MQQRIDWSPKNQSRPRGDRRVEFWDYRRIWPCLPRLSSVSTTLKKCVFCHCCANMTTSQHKAGQKGIFSWGILVVLSSATLGSKSFFENADPNSLLSIINENVCTLMIYVKMILLSFVIEFEDVNLLIPCSTSLSIYFCSESWEFLLILLRAPVG